MSSLPHLPSRWIVAHRGASGCCPENTRSAFGLALIQNADAIECDVQLTADGQIVICHDASLDRFGHIGIRICETPLAALQQFDIGNWFAPEFHDQRLLSLDELLVEFGSRLPLWIELKTEHLSLQQIDQLATTLVRQIESHRLQQQVAFLCFDVTVLQTLRDRAAWATLVLNTHQPQLICHGTLPAHPWLNALDGNIRQMSRSVVGCAHDHGMRSMAFTCNDHDDVVRAWTMGVDAVITNFPQQTREILRTGGYLTYAA